MILCKLTNNWLTLVKKNKGVFVWEENRNRARDLLFALHELSWYISTLVINKKKNFYFFQLAVSLISIRFYTAILTELIIFITICTKYKTLFQRLCEVCFFCGNLHCVVYFFLLFLFVEVFFVLSFLNFYFSCRLV